MNGMQSNDNMYQGYANQEVAVRKTMVGVYGWMSVALLVSAIVGLYVATNMNLLYTLVATSAYWLVAIAEIVVVIVLSARAMG